MQSTQFAGAERYLHKEKQKEVNGRQSAKFSSVPPPKVFGRKGQGNLTFDFLYFLHFLQHLHPSYMTLTENIVQ